MITPKPATVRELYEGHPERWTQKEAMRDAAGEQVAEWKDEDRAAYWCLWGAVHYVYGFAEVEAFSKLYRHELSPIEFNDTHTFEEVLELVKKAGI